MLFVLGIAALTCPFSWTLRPAITIQVVDSADTPMHGMHVEFESDDGPEVFRYKVVDDIGECSFPEISERMNIISFLLKDLDLYLLIVRASNGSKAKWRELPELSTRSGQLYGIVHLPGKFPHITWEDFDE